MHYDDVKPWCDNNTVQQMVLRGQNSFVASRPSDEFEVDFFYINDKEDDEYKISLAGIDVFSRFGTCFASANKTPEQSVEGLKRMFERMGGRPKIIFADEEGSMQSKITDECLKDENKRCIINRNHCRFVERFIRTIKIMMYIRLEKRPVERWYSFVIEILVTYDL